MQKHATAYAVFQVMLLDNIHLRHRLKTIGAGGWIKGRPGILRPQ